MRITAFTILCIVAIGLFIIHHLGWIGDRLFNRIVGIATVIAAAAGVMVFIIPAATVPQSKPVTSTTPQQPLAQSDNVAKTNMSQPQQISQRFDPDNVYIKDQVSEEEINVVKGNTGKLFNNEIIISVENITFDNQVFTTIGSSRGHNINIKGKKVGYVTYYETDEDVFKVRIGGIHYNVDSAQFIVTRLPRQYFIFVEADNKGVVKIKGNTDMAKLIQFCPDEYADDCGPNLEFGKKGEKFALSIKAIRKRQYAFNFQDSKGNWLKISERVLTLGKNLAIKKSANGAYFVYSNFAN